MLGKERTDTDMKVSCMTHVTRRLNELVRSKTGRDEETQEGGEDEDKQFGNVLYYPSYKVKENKEH